MLVLQIWNLFIIFSQLILIFTTYHISLSTKHFILCPTNQIYLLKDAKEANHLNPIKGSLNALQEESFLFLFY